VLNGRLASLEVARKPVLEQRSASYRAYRSKSSILAGRNDSRFFCVQEAAYGGRAKEEYRVTRIVIEWLVRIFKRRRAIRRRVIYFSSRGSQLNAERGCSAIAAREKDAFAAEIVAQFSDQIGSAAFSRVGYGETGGTGGACGGISDRGDPE
jgi:hypothetical protein